MGAVARNLRLAAAGCLVVSLAACDEKLAPPIDGELTCAPETADVGATINLVSEIRKSASVSMLTLVRWFALDDRKQVATAPTVAFGSEDAIVIPDSEEVHTAENTFTATVAGRYRIRAAYEGVKARNNSAQVDFLNDCYVNVGVEDCGSDGETLDEGEACCPGFAEGEDGKCAPLDCTPVGEYPLAADCCEGLVLSDSVCADPSCDADRFTVIEPGTGPNDGSGLVEDNDTGLTWAMHPYIATTYDQAVDFCEADDARLPTLEEAEAITHPAVGNDCPWPWTGFYTFTSTVGVAPGTYMYVQGGGTISEEDPADGDVIVLCVR